MFHYATALRSNDLAQRRAAIKELCRLGTEAPLSALDYLLPLLQDSEAAIRDGATEILLNLSKGGADGVLNHLSSMLAGNKSTRLRALRIIARVGPGARSMVPALVAALKTDDPVTARMAGEALCAIGADALPALESVQTDPHPLMQQEVARVLRKLQGTHMDTVPDFSTVPPEPSPKPSNEEVFRAWLATMEEGMSMLQARRATAERFSLSETEMRAIEDEGLKCGWDK
jgi:HEAT repeat protein